jgi:hypothetical protein
MLRGHTRYNYVTAADSYHAIAKPFFEPVKGVKMRFPKTLENTLRASRQCGPLVRNLHPVVPDNGYHNFVAAFNKRCNYSTDKRWTPRMVASASHLLRKVLPENLPTVHWSKALFDEWLTAFGEEKRARMIAAMEKLDFSTVDDYRNKDLFTKVEALMIINKPNWAPRVIYKSSDLHNALAGPIINQLMKRLDDAFTHMDGPVRIRTPYRKLPTQFVPELEREHADDYWMETDFTANDKTQTKDVSLVVGAFQRALGAPEWLVRLDMLSNDYRVKSSVHGVSFKASNSMPTGFAMTTFRNCILNACIVMAYCLQVRPIDAVILIMGDDMIAKFRGRVAYATKIYDSIAAEANMGAKTFRHDQLFKATFLSKLFVPCDSLGRHFVVPLLGKALARFNMRANNNESVSDAQYMAYKSVGYAYEFRYLPSVRDMFLIRFKHEFSKVPSTAKADSTLLDVSWNAKAAGVTLRNIKYKLVVSQSLSDFDFTCFCLERYNLLGLDVLQAFEDIVLNDTKIDMDSVVYDKLISVDC